MKDTAGEMIYFLCDGLEKGIVDYKIIFNYCTSKNLDRLNLNPMIRPMVNMMYGENYWNMMKNCYEQYKKDIEIIEPVDGKIKFKI